MEFVCSVRGLVIAHEVYGHKPTCKDVGGEVEMRYNVVFNNTNRLK